MRAYHLYGKPGNPGENSNGTVHPSGNCPEKRNTFRGITFFPFLPKRPKCLLLFVWLTSSGPPLEAEGEKCCLFPGGLRCFANGTTLTHSSFRKRF